MVNVRGTVVKDLPVNVMLVTLENGVKSVSSLDFALKVLVGQSQTENRRSSDHRTDHRTIIGLRRRAFQKHTSGCTIFVIIITFQHCSKLSNALH